MRHKGSLNGRLILHERWQHWMWKLLRQTPRLCRHLRWTRGRWLGAVSHPLTSLCLLTSLGSRDDEGSWAIAYAEGQEVGFFDEFLSASAFPVALDVMIGHWQLGALFAQLWSLKGGKGVIVIVSRQRHLVDNVIVAGVRNPTCAIVGGDYSRGGSGSVGELDWLMVEYSVRWVSGVALVGLIALQFVTLCHVRSQSALIWSLITSLRLSRHF